MLDILKRKLNFILFYKFQRRLLIYERTTYMLVKSADIKIPRSVFDCLQCVLPLEKISFTIRDKSKLQWCIWMVMLSINRD